MYLFKDLAYKLNQEPSLRQFIASRGLWNWFLAFTREFSNENGAFYAGQLPIKNNNFIDLISKLCPIESTTTKKRSYYKNLIKTLLNLGILYQKEDGALAIKDWQGDSQS